MCEFWIRTNTLIKLLNKTQRGLALECGFSERRIAKTKGRQEMA